MYPKIVTSFSILHKTLSVSPKPCTFKVFFMTELLKHLEETDESSIPLLRDEINEEAGQEMGLFTEEEIRQSQRRKRVILALKLFIPLFLIGFFLITSFKTYRYISYDLRNQKLNYKLNSVSIKKSSGNEFNLSINATVDANVPWSVVLKGFTIDILSDNESKDVIITTKIPDFQVISGEMININLYDQSFEIKNSKKLAEIINKSLKKKEAKIPLRIRTNVHPHWIPFTFKNIKIEEEVYVNLRRKGSKIDVKLIDLKMEEAANDDLKLTVELDVNNPLPFSVDEVPPITMEIYNEKFIFIGKLKTLEKMRLKKNRVTRVKLQVNLDGSSDSKTSDAIGEIITNHLIGKKSKIYLLGDKQTSENFNWLQSFLKDLIIPIEIPGKITTAKIGMFEDSIKKIDVKRIFFSLDPQKPNQIELNSEAEVQFNIPRFASMMNPKIESLTLEGKVSDQKGNFIAPLLIPNHQIGKGLSNQNSLNTSMKLNINVNNINVSNVESLMEEMLYAQDTTVSISGHSSVKTKMFIGKMTVPRVPFSTDIKLPGLGRVLSSQEPEIKDVKINEIIENEMILSALISVKNPTEITSLMGLIHLNCLIEDNRKHLGTVLMENASILPGGNELEAKILLKKSSVLEEFIGNFVSGKDQKLILQGVQGSSAVHPILKNVIGAFVMKVKLKSEAIFGKFISSVTLKRKGFNLLPQAFMTVSNPFKFPIKILSVKDLKVFAYKIESDDDEELVLITEMDNVPLEEALIIPANVENWVDEENPLPLQMNGNILRSIKALEMLLSKENPKDENGKKYLPIRIEGRIRSEMDEMQLEFTFIKNRLPLYFEII